MNLNTIPRTADSIRPLSRQVARAAAVKDGGSGPEGIVLAAVVYGPDDEWCSRL